MWFSRQLLLPSMFNNMEQQTRTRTSGTISSETRTLKYGTIPGSPATQTVTVYTKHKYKKTTDVVTKEFKRLRNSGMILNNPLDIVDVEVNCTEEPYEVIYRDYVNGNLVRTEYYQPADGSKGPNYSRWFSSDLVGLNAASPTFVSNHMDAAYPCSGLASAKQRTLAKALASAAESDALLLVTAAEGAKTLDSAGRLLTLLPRFNDWVKKNRKKLLRPSGALRLIGSLASQWLEYRYGFMQLYYDFKSYQKAYGSDGTSRRWRFVSSETIDSTIPNVSLPTQYQYFDQLVTKYRKRKTVVSSGCLIQLIDGTLRQRGDVGLDRLLTTAWELVPFSFIIDWFVDTADRIAAHEGRFDQLVVAKWTTVRSTCAGQYYMSRTGRSYTAGNTTYVGSVRSSFGAFEVLRHVSRTPDPTLSVLPQLKVKLNWQKMTDLVSLLVTSKANLRG